MFGPPEVITGRLMSGAGAGPMVAASAEFTASAIACEVSVERLTALLGYLTTSWQGEAAIAMERAVMQFIISMRVLQAQVMLSATRTASQAAAFSEAYTTMAQMVEITENRVTTAVLHATNFLGMNTVPIGVREGQYQEMWIRDVAVQTNYLAQTVANTTFVPFAPLPPITGIPSFPPLVTQAINAAAAATDTVTLAAIQARNMAAVWTSRSGMAAGTAAGMTQRARNGAQQAEAQAAVARFREGQAERGTEQPTQRMAQQLLQQAPQQAMSMAQQAFQAPQQAVQQVQQMGQQFGSQISNLMGQVSPEHRLDNPGFFDTRPDSATLDRLAGNSGAGGMTAAIRVPGLSGLSGASTGFRFPNGWDGALPGAVPPQPAPPPAAPNMATRPMGSGMPLHAARRREDHKTQPVKRAATELVPLWGPRTEDPATISPGALVEAEQHSTARAP